MMGAVEKRAFADVAPAEAAGQAVSLAVTATEEEKRAATRQRRAHEQALALDPALMTRMEEKIGLADAGMAAALQLLEIAPNDELEHMLAIQLVAMHGLALRATSRAHATDHPDRYRDYINAANKSSRTFAALMEALNRRRGKSSEQKVTVEHVHVYEGGKAIVGNVEAGGRRGGKRRKGRTAP